MSKAKNGLVAAAGLLIGIVTLRAIRNQSGDSAEELAEAVADAAQTGRRGDGKVFALPVARRIDIRTQSWSQRGQTPDGDG